MELRKQKEIEYYDTRAEKWLKDSSEHKWQGDFEGFRLDLLAGYNFCYQLLKEHCRGKKILDYGCGNGIHAVFLAKSGGEVTGIDLSEPSLQIAKERARHEGVQDKIVFLKMDCETMDFDNNSFDIIFDGGTFSSLDLNKALPELARILKPDGILIGIETFGHNPFTNLKRKLNKIIGKRTGWASSHILRMKDLKETEKYFNKIETRFFHLTSWIVFPFLDLPVAKLFLKLLDLIDKILLKLPVLNKYAFKVVFIFSNPIKPT